jgi:hypothetical protein
LKISELIENLNRYTDDHGDQEIEIWGKGGKTILLYEDPVHICIIEDDQYEG